MRYVERDTVFPSPQVVTEELVSDGKFCGRLFGLEVSGGMLVPAYTCTQLSAVSAPPAAENGYLCSLGNLYVYYSGTVYRCSDLRSIFYSAGTGFVSQPFYAECCEDGENFILISDGTKQVTVTLNAIQPESSVPVKGAVFHYSRLFGIDKDDAHIVRWSCPGAVKDWTESLRGAGYVKLDPVRGNIVGLVRYDDKLIALREYGFTVIRAYGDAENFKVEVTDTDTDAIIAGAYAVCADKLFFFTKSGLYAYDGSDSERFEPDGLAGFGDVCCAASHMNVLFAGGKLDGEDAIACINCDSGNVSFIKKRADCICSAKRLAFFGDGLYEITAGGESGVWNSGDTDFGVSGKKYLRGIALDGDVLTVRVESGGRARSFISPGNYVKVGMSGEKFRIEIECGSALRSVRAEYTPRG